MAHKKKNTAYIPATVNLTAAEITQAQTDGALPPAGVIINVIDTTGKIVSQKQSTGETTAPSLDTGGGAPGDVFEDWATGKEYAVGHKVLATVAIGAIGVGSRLRRKTAGIARAAFDATEALAWDEMVIDDDVVPKTDIVDNLTTSDATKVLSAKQGKDLQDLKAPLASPTFTGTVAGITKAMVGLGLADNTADTAKPVSTAQQTALDGKSATTHNHAGTYEPSNANIQSHIVSTVNPHSVNATQVGLGNVSNTSDLLKPISTAQQTALDLKVDKITGKGLSANDYTTAEQTKLSGIASGAEVNLQPDWNQVTTTEDDFIKNKPTIPAAVIVNNTLTSTSTTEALSAAQGKVLQDGKKELYEGTVALRTPNNLTSNTSDSNYILTASSEHTTHLFYRAFDGNDANHWYTLGTSVANGVIELRYKIRPTNLLLRGETTTTEYWTRWQLQGSNNGTTWDTLVDRSGVDEFIQNTSKNFPITTTKEYKYFRFNGLNAVGTNIPLSRLEISGVESERNFIDWTSYTPVVTSESGTWSSYLATGRYRIIDKMLTASFRVQFNGLSSNADALYVSIPSGLTMNASVMTGGAGWDTDQVGFGILGDSGTISGVPAIITTRTTLKVLVKYYNAAASSYLTCPGLSNTAPWTWTTNDTVDGQFVVPIL